MSKHLSTRTIGLILFWVALLFLLSIPLGRYLDRQVNPNIGVTVSIDANGSPGVTLQQNRYGHYVTSGQVNGMPVTFLLDTGATTVSVPAAIASRLKLGRGAPQTVRTANGTVTVYATRLNAVSIDALSVGNVSAHINPHMDGDEILLGMSFLRHLDFIQSGKRLTLRLRTAS